MTPDVGSLRTALAEELTYQRAKLREADAARDEGASRYRRGAVAALEAVYFRAALVAEPVTPEPRAWDGTPLTDPELDAVPGLEQCDAIDDAWSMARCQLPRGHEGLHDAEPAPSEREASIERIAAVLRTLGDRMPIFSSEPVYGDAPDGSRVLVELGHETWYGHEQLAERLYDAGLRADG